MIEVRVTHAPETLVVNVFPDSVTIKAVSDGIIINHKYCLTEPQRHLVLGTTCLVYLLSEATWLKYDNYMSQKLAR